MQTRIRDVNLAFEDRGQGPAVVLIHGFPLCRRMWAPQLQALSGAGFRVIAPDLRGFGDSEAGGAEFSMDVFADDMAALMDHLQVEGAVVGGMSMGGYVLLDLLERYPERIKGALFIVTRSGADDENGRARRTQLAREVMAGRPEVVHGAFREVLFAARTLRERPDLVADVREWIGATSSEGLAGGLLAMRDRKDYTELLPKFTLPALVLGAREDQAVPLEHSRILAKGLPDSRSCFIENAGHMVNLERPEVFNRCVLDFLREISG